MRRVQPLRVSTFAVPKRAVLLSGARSDQSAGSLPGAARPAFSYLVLGALRGWADGDGDGSVSASEVLGYASKAMGATMPVRKQTPELAGNSNVVLAKHGGEKSPDLTEIVAALSRGEKIAFNGNGVVLTELPSLKLAEVTRDGLSEGVDLSRIDMAKERELEAQYLALQHAKQKVDGAKAAKKGDASGEKQEKAWCELAELGGPNPYRADARKACAQMRTFVEQRKRMVAAMEHDWEKTVVPFMGLASRKVADKQKVMAAFVSAYAVLGERHEVKAGEQALGQLKSGTLPAWAGKDAGELQALAASEAAAARFPNMVRIESGSFDNHEVGDFWLDVYEVTVSHYARCVAAGACQQRTTTFYSGTESPSNSNCNANNKSRGEHPMNCVDQDDATAYCKWAGKRLPTEWEWEWAARGGSKGYDYPWGNQAPSESLVVFKSSNGTQPVGSKPKGKSVHGVHDLAGNVWEWTSSAEGENRVLRGGGWGDGDAARLSASLRNHDSPSVRSNDVGFRCARTDGR